MGTGDKGPREATAATAADGGGGGDAAAAAATAEDEPGPRPARDGDRAARPRSDR